MLLDFSTVCLRLEHPNGSWLKLEKVARGTCLKGASHQLPTHTHWCDIIFQDFEWPRYTWSSECLTTFGGMNFPSITLTFNGSIHSMCLTLIPSFTLSPTPTSMGTPSLKLSSSLTLSPPVIWLLNLEPISTLLLGAMLKYLITGNPSLWTSIFT